jgi:hypothetical protein
MYLGSLTSFCTVFRTPDDRFSGNGGLSLRRVSAIRRVLSFQARYNDTEPEDEWFGKRLWVLRGEKVASGTNGVLAVEDVYIDNAMGYHIRDGGLGINPAVWKLPEQRKKIFEYCPELSLIMDMKLERERCPDDNQQGGLGPTEEEIKKQKELEEQRQKEEEERRQKEEEENRKKTEEEKKKQEEEKKKQEEKKKSSGAVDTAVDGLTPEEIERLKLDYGIGADELLTTGDATPGVGGEIPDTDAQAKGKAGNSTTARLKARRQVG